MDFRKALIRFHCWWLQGIYEKALLLCADRLLADHYGHPRATLRTATGYWRVSQRRRQRLLAWGYSLPARCVAIEPDIHRFLASQAALTSCLTRAERLVAEVRTIQSHYPLTKG